MERGLPAHKHPDPTTLQASCPHSIEHELHRPNVALHQRAA
ncbi:Uncharacterised protein [Kingella negevensis]|uniref:Uncharacterized protein n=1 Tax=Kingella negevensis TaxID=1522312 RepID=A0A238HF80_9NEIS|nr:Uncharacterised protein [Kingella negevensis]